MGVTGQKKVHFVKARGDIDPVSITAAVGDTSEHFAAAAASSKHLLCRKEDSSEQQTNHQTADGDQQDYEYMVPQSQNMFHN